MDLDLGFLDSQGLARGVRLERCLQPSLPECPPRLILLWHLPPFHRRIKIHYLFCNIFETSFDKIDRRSDLSSRSRGMQANCLPSVPGHALFCLSCELPFQLCCNGSIHLPLWTDCRLESTRYRSVNQNPLSHSQYSQKSIGRQICPLVVQRQI